MKQITGIKVGKTNITSTYSDGVSRSDMTEFIVTAVSLGTISSIVDIDPRLTAVTVNALLSL